MGEELADLNALLSKPIAKDGHEIILFYEVDGLAPAEGPRGASGALTLGDLAATPQVGVSAANLAAMAEPAHAGKHPWQQAAPGKRGVGSDFHAHIEDALAGRRPDLLAFWRLDPAVVRLERTGLAVVGKREPAKTAPSPAPETPAADAGGASHKVRSARQQFRMRWSPAQRRRMEAATVSVAPLTLIVEDIKLALFGTGLGFAIVRITLARDDRKPILASELLEAQTSLGRINELALSDSGDDAAGADKTRIFSLGNFVRQLALGPMAKTKRHGRVNTSTFARFDDVLPTAARDRFGVLLARHFTADYALSDAPEGTIQIGTFETVRHTIGAEGTATIMGPTPEHPVLPSFLGTYQTHTFRQNYANLVLLALHEQAFLVDRTTRSVVPASEAAVAEKVIERLEALREDTLLFRYGYRFSEVSYLSPHSLFNRSLRDVLRLDLLHAELSADVTETHAHLENARAAALERRFFWASILGAAAFAGLTTYTIVKEVLKLVLGKPYFGAIAVAIGVVAALIAACVVRKRGKRGYGRGFTIDAMQKQMTKRGLK